MRFHALIGVLPHEATVAQPLEIDLTVRRAPPDLAGGVLDYRTLYDLVAAVVHRGPARFLEDVGRDIADAAMRVDGVSSVRVAARKPHVTLPGPLDYAEVVIERAHR
jgi:dihydroneopterin aldolase